MELVGAFILGSVGQLVIAVAVMQADQDHLFWLANGGLAKDRQGNNYWYEWSARAVHGY